MRIFASFLVFLFAVSLGLTLPYSVSAQDAENARGAKQDDSVSVESPTTSLLVDDFNYSGLLTANGWSAHSGALTNSPSTTTGLTYAGYPNSGVGNAVQIGNAGGEDVNKPLSAEQNTNGATVYYSFLANVNDAATAKTGDYFIHIGDRTDAATFTLFAARVFARIVGGSVNFGISNGSASPVYGTTNFNRNQTYLLIVKYTINTGGADSTSLWVIPSGVPASEGTAGTPEATETTVNGQDIIDAIALRQGSATNSCQVVVDGIRVGTTWSDLVSAGSSATPPKLFKAYLNGSNEVPANASTATGFGRVVLNAAETQITASFYFSNLSANSTAGHIHGPAAAGTNGPVLFDMTPPTGVTSGSSVDKVFSVTPTQVADLKAGLWYFNVHSTANPGGEIRGQIRVAKPRFDTDGDGDSDYGIVRPGAGGGSGQLTWYTTLNQGTGNDPFTINQWGLNSDVVTPGDFDGDGKADIAFWRQTGTPAFFILRSSTGTLQQIVFGLPGDDPTIVADYDGDGKDNAAIYRPGATPGAQSFFWNIHTSGPLTGVQVVQAWGLGSDLAIPGDFDGDGRADLCVTRNIGGANVFIVNTSSGAVTYTTFGLSATDLVAPGDYDGDGKTDYAVTRVEAGTIVWYYRPSSGGPDVRVGWGSVAAGDFEAQGDYDGDGKTDIAVWRESGGSTFFVNASTGGTRFQRWGLVGDSPSIYDIH